MRNLEDFPAPVDGQIALGEINGQIHYENDQNIQPFTTLIEKLAKIFISRELLQSPSLRDEGRSLFLPVEVSFLKQLTQVYYEQGFVEALHTLATHDGVIVAKTASLALKFIEQFNKLQTILNPSLRFDLQQLLNDLSQSRNWSRDTIRYICWHPHIPTKVAIATCDDSVRIYSGDNNLVSLLRCKQQKHVTCLSWRPNSMSEIAVGHENGVIVWTIDTNTLVSRPSISNAIILYRLDHRPIVSLVWSPKGDLLLTASACQSTILVWDVELDRTSSLKRSGASGNCLLKWSPTGDKLFSCTNSFIFRIWNCNNWECERWTILSGRVQSACWSNCGTNLLFATNTEPIIYGLIVKNDLIFSSDLDNTSNQALPLFDLTKLDLNGRIVGGLVKSMETDPKGEHLAVLFCDTNSIAVFNVIRQQTLQLMPSSLIVGFPEETPSSIAFLQNFKSGACLTIGWSSGRLQYYPIVYTDGGNITITSRSQADNKSLYTSF